jgi:hypothetical protein
MPLLISLGGSIVLLAIIATLVSKQAQTGSVLTSAGSSLASILAAATSPVTGSSGSQFGTAPSLGPPALPAAPAQSDTTYVPQGALQQIPTPSWAPAQPGEILT